jgi:hypothetical protein
MEPITTKGIGTTVKVCVNLAKAVGPLFLSQFDYAKFKYLDFKMKQAQTAGYAEYFLAEARSLVELKAEQTRDALNKQGLERLQAEENVKIITKEINKLLVYSKVPAHIRYLEEDKEPQDSEASDEKIEINETWLDRFNNLASKLNEDWRQNLLAKSFAIEAEKPGTIDLDTLFTIARLDQKSFYFFDAILSISLKMYEVYFLPTHNDPVAIKVDVNGTEYDIGNIIYQLQHTGLLLHDERLGVNLDANRLAQFRYGDDVLAAKPPIHLHVSGIITSRTGSALAALCTTSTNEIGYNNFNAFESYLQKNNALFKRYSLT